MSMNESRGPLVTIIVAVFNGAKTIQQCIDSVAAQSYINKELIIIDGGSTDGTIELLEANRAHITHYKSEPDTGIYNAWNKGLALASGDWVCFLGADDFFWTPTALAETSAQLARLQQTINVAYTQIMLLTADGTALYPVGEPWERIRERFSQLMCIPHQGVLHRTELFARYGRFDESFRIAGDYEMLLRDLRQNHAVFIPGIILTGMRAGGVSSDPQGTLKTMREIRRAQRLHGFNLPGPLWLAAMLRVYIRLLLWRTLGERLTRRVLDYSRRARGLDAYWTKL